MEPNTIRSPRAVRLFVFLALLTQAVSTIGLAVAGERAIMVDGRELLVESRNARPGGWLVSLSGGGEVMVPLSQVERFELIPEAPPPVAGAPDSNPGACSAGSPGSDSPTADCPEPGGSPSGLPGQPMTVVQ